MSDFEVRGADDFLRLSKALKHAGRTGLRKELNKQLGDAAKPLIPKTRAVALERLPKSGGLAAQVAKAPQRVQVRTGKDPGVRIGVSKSNSGARGANKGSVRHSVFGDKTRYVDQQVPSGWFDDTLKDSARDVLPYLEQALENVAEQIVRGV